MTRDDLFNVSDTFLSYVVLFARVSRLSVVSRAFIRTVKLPD